MSTLQYAAHVNDAGITLLCGEQLVYREPGFALLDEARLLTGNEAFARARIDPRRIQHRYWSELATTPLPDQRFRNLSAADLAGRQLEQMWESAGGGRDDGMLLAVPAWLEQEQLALLLGIAQEIGLPVVGLVDAAVAATRREYRKAVPVHIDLGLHATSLTRLAQPGQVKVEKSETLPDCGLYRLYDAWIRTVAEAFVRQSRFDPLHTAETEQMLLNGLGGWLAQAAREERVELQLEHAGLEHRAEVESLALIAAAAPVYQQIVNRLRALCRAEDMPAIQVTDRVARLPGLTDMLQARVGGQVFSLEPGATCRGALARWRDLPAQAGGISLRRQLPWDRTAAELRRDTARPAHAGVPTHLLLGSRAFAIGGDELVVGSQPAERGRGILLPGDMAGVSRRHCSLRKENGQCVLQDHSRYGTFLNGHRIDGSTVLQVGDSVRVGSPGVEFRLITTDESADANARH